MKETIRRSDRMQKRCSSSYSGRGRRATGPASSPAGRTLLLASVLAAFLAPGIAAQEAAARAAPGAEVPSPVLTREAELSEAEAALGELSRRVSALADAVEEDGPMPHRAVLEDLRAELEAWSDTISAMSVEPAEDADINRRRFRRFERRIRSSTADVNAAVEQINESLRSST